MLVLKNLKCKDLLKLKNIVQLACCKAAASSSSSASNIINAANCSFPQKQKRAVNALKPDVSYGQPTPLTHPHLLNEGELVPSVMVAEFQERRTRLMTTIQKYSREHVQLGQTNSNHMVIIPSSTKKYMSDKIPYIFRQNSDFFYLTGCLEPDTVLVMTIDEQATILSMLFMRPKDKHSELWDGPRTGVDGALDLFGVDEAFPRDLFQTEINRRISSDKPIIWYDARTSELPKITSDMKNIHGSALLLNSPTNFVQSMRVFKSLSEQNLMRRTCAIASEAISEVIRETRPGISEHQLYAMVDHKCRMRGASHLAYPPVVASGVNATTIHYINNLQLTKSGEMVLMDAGCEYGGYTSDITRTWPVNGTFTSIQKTLYDVVLQLQKSLIDSLIHGERGDTLDNLFDLMCIKLGKYMQEVGLVSKGISSEGEYAKAGYRFCPHHVSHYLGMDVHDTPLIPRSLRLQPGMVFTVEPGIYIGEDRLDLPQEFRGIGIRIEDDILINSQYEVEVLTSGCVKERQSLENFFKEKQ